jgi:hypothetical protein
MGIEEQHEILMKFYKELFDNQEDCPQEFVDIFNENFWELLDD